MHAAEQILCCGFWIWRIDQCTHHSNRAHASAQYLWELLSRNAANGHQWVLLHQPHIGLQACHTLRCGGHFLERGGEHGTKGDIAGLHRMGAHHSA